MSDPETTAEARADTEPVARDRAQYGVCAFLALLGGLVVFDAATLDGFTASNDPVGPKPMPFILGAALIVVAIVYAIDVARGGRGESETEHAARFDGKTIVLLSAVFIANALLIDWLGWVISGALLFWGASIVLGGRRYFISLAVAVALGLATFYGFAIGLGVGLPAGILQGIL